MPLALVRRPRSPFWIVRGSIKDSALKKARRLLTEDSRKKSAPSAKPNSSNRRSTVVVFPRTFAQAVVSYLEGGGPKRFLKPIVELFAETPLDRIDQTAIERGARKVYPDASAATVNRQFFTPVSAILHHAARRGLCAPVIIERPKVAAAPFRWLTPAEAERLIEAASDHLRPLLIFMLLTGARSGEALGLDWRNVDLARGQVAFLDTEERRGPRRARCIGASSPSWPTSAAPRGPRVPKAGRAALRLGPKGGEDTSSAAHASKRRSTGPARRAGIEDVSPHDLRHTWATWHYADQPRPHGAAEAWRVEVDRDGSEVCARQCRRACAYDRPPAERKRGRRGLAAWGTFGAIGLRRPGGCWISV